jgi:hypothetical protein
MATISNPTTMSLPGPWLLDSKSLGELDDLLDSCADKMRHHRSESIESAVAEKLAFYTSIEKVGNVSRSYVDNVRQEVVRSYEFRIDSRQWTVYLSRGRTAEGAGFKELVSLANVHEEVPRGFAVSTRVARARIEVELGSWLSSGLTINVSSDDKNLSQELFGKMQNWATELQPKKWLQRWSAYGSLVGFLLLLLWFVTLGTALLIMLIPQPGPNRLMQQAQELARQGVNSSNQAQAIELLLALESGYEPWPPSPSIHRHPSARFWICLLLSLGIILGVRRPPKGAIGIWGGRVIIEKQRNWIQRVSVGLPALLVADILLPWLWGYIALRR